MERMNAKEIREKVEPMVIWMADATIKKARAAISGKDVFCRYPKETPDYNKPEVEMASAILFRTFNNCEYELREALIKMPEEYDGFTSSCGSYFNAFIEALGNGCGVCLREPDWVLEKI